MENTSTTHDISQDQYSFLVQDVVDYTWKTNLTIGDFSNRRACQETTAALMEKRWCSGPCSKDVILWKLPKKKQQVEKEFWTLRSTFWVTHHSSQERSGVFSCVFWVTDSPTAPFHLWSLWWTARPPILLDILHQLTWCNLQSNCCNRMLIRLLNKLIEQSLSIKHLVVLLTC